MIPYNAVSCSGINVLNISISKIFIIHIEYMYIKLDILYSLSVSQG